ncbi:hypothetical protein ACFYY5_29140 [Nocardia elegans]|uniref:Uncharacterized protein n=1 Tax=Nocardia elegans TaxID=300029 RepID=A0ABW6TNW0_9NOCA
MSDWHPAGSEAEDLACAWAEHRKDFGENGSAYNHFKAGWDAAHGRSESGPLR